MLTTLTACALALTAHPAGADAQGGVPSDLIGVWEVEHVAVDGQDQIHWGVRPEEPELIGRTLVISAEEVRFEGDKAVQCKQSKWRPRHATWAYLFAKGFPRPPVGGRSPNPTPDDFNVKVNRTQRVIAYSVCPQPGPDANRFPMDSWVALQGPDRLAFHMDAQVLLLLHRRPTDAKPVASFDCGKAESPTEKTICGSFDLASWDRSVALAFRQALARRPEKEKELRAGQQAWLRERDACGANASCVDEHLWRRVDDLKQQ
jgi:uncharacterized protein YecT (DUF1311 family)